MRRTRYSADRLLPPAVSRFVAAALVLLVAVPLLYMVLLALSPNTTVALGGTGLKRLSLANFTGMWSTAPMLHGLLNSVLIAGISAVLAVTLGLAAAYPLARLRFRARRPMLYSLLGSQTIPSIALLLPLFIVLASIQGVLGIQLIGSYPPVILTYLTFGLPLATWICFSYLRAMPPDLENAALVDGCTRLGALRHVVAPLMAPALVVSLVFAFLVGWNDLLFASALTNSQTQTVAVALQQFGAAAEQNAAPLYGQLMAAALVSAVPVVVLYLAFQRYVVSGLAAGAISG
jgi:multiple sugar transport system permease protein